MTPENLGWWRELTEPQLRKLGRTVFVVLALQSAQKTDRSTLAEAIVASLRMLGEVPTHQALFIRRASRPRLLAMMRDVADKSAWKVDAALEAKHLVGAVGHLLSKLTPSQRLELAKLNRPAPSPVVPA